MDSMAFDTILPMASAGKMPPMVMVESGIGPNERWALRRLGHRVVDAPAAGAVQLVLRGANGTLDGAADPRKGGAAVGW